VSRDSKASIPPHAYCPPFKGFHHSDETWHDLIESIVFDAPQTISEANAKQGPRLNGWRMIVAAINE
jgi:hypothetical protein